MSNHTAGMICDIMTRVEVNPGPVWNLKPPVHIRWQDSEVGDILLQQDNGTK